MSILRDILDLKDDLSNISDEDKPFKNNLRGSIAKESSPGIFQFPELVSTSISLQETTMVSKATERQYVSFISVITSIDSVTDEKSVHQYLQRLHQNFNGDMITGMRESFALPTPLLGRLAELRESENNAVTLMKQLKGEDGEICLDDECEEVVNFNNLSDEDKETVRPIVAEKCKEGKCYKFSENDGLNEADSTIFISDDSFIKFFMKNTCL